MPQSPNKRTLRKHCGKSSVWFCINTVDSMRRRFCPPSMTQLYNPSYVISSKAGIKTKKLQQGKTWTVVKDQREKYLATNSASITSLVIKILEHCTHSSWLCTCSLSPLQIISFSNFKCSGTGFQAKWGPKIELKITLMHN